MALAALSLTSALLTGWHELPVLATAVFFGLIIPPAAAFKCHPGWPRKAMAGCTVLMALVGIGALALVIVGASRDAFGGVFGLFLVGLMLSFWVANLLISHRPRF